ncbi:MAG: hypothetical protein H6622_17100 [Halobacteriovoraceae bacterium]|nr:hypothetical protein [Halobacteriovoraceae bacterium]
MDRAKYASQIKTKSEELRRTKTIELFLVLSVLILVFLLATKDSSEKTVLVPMSLDKEIWVKGDNVSNSYVETITLPLFNNLLNFNKENALNRFNFVLKHTNPAYYEELKTKLYTDSERISRNDISSSFHPIELVVNKVGDRYKSTIKGELISIIGSDIIKKRVESFEMLLTYKNNFLSIVSYGPKKEGEGNE